MTANPTPLCFGSRIATHTHTATHTHAGGDAGTSSDSGGRVSSPPCGQAALAALALRMSSSSAERSPRTADSYVLQQLGVVAVYAGHVCQAPSPMFAVFKAQVHLLSPVEAEHGPHARRPESGACFQNVERDGLSTSRQRHAARNPISSCTNPPVSSVARRAGIGSPCPSGASS